MAGQRVLIAYGTKNGGTAGIAETMGEALRSLGLEVDVRDATEVRDTTGYAAVVLGGALYMHRWHKDATRFARRHRRELSGKPVWLFSSGPLDNSAAEGDIPPVATARRAETALRARQHRTFGGVLDERAQGRIARRMVANGTGGDFRDRDQITAWATEIGTALQAVAPAEPT
ncbi:MAG TPA: flavodoxin domain-containing protein [Pseudonocardiaceae bacterium]|nr:flavodoxin domain-containing protein [Pseudonocardiaceae bacterium]